MDINSNDRKKILVAFVILFLVVGGGIFTFFVFQGLGDLKGGNKMELVYDFAKRTALLPMFQYFGLEDEEKHAAPIRDRGMNIELFKKPQADISDWMAKGAASGAGPNTDTTGAASALMSKGSLIGGMSGFGGGQSGTGGGGGGGGGSQTTDNASSFGSGGGAGNVNISGGQSGGKGGPQGKGGVLGSLAGTQSLMGEGLRSSSAMFAKSKWDQAFGVGSAGKSEALAYAKTGLVNLDTIKSGEIENLKTTGDINTLKPAPVRDLDAEKHDANLAKMNGAEGKDAAKDALTGAAGQVSKQADQGAKDEKTGKTVDVPPPEVIKLATTEPPDGTFCPKGCGKDDGYYKDNPPPNPSYSKGEDGKWSATYAGKDAQGQTYNDKVQIDPGGNPPVKPLTSSVMIDGVWTKCEAGTSTPADSAPVN
ncbi:MAG: hypothetical protein NTX59_12745 [Elusimicrobia bacterium]|nr:hypothetical protein [Elusimicrobiota bacterium]